MGCSIGEVGEEEGGTPGGFVSLKLDGNAHNRAYDLRNVNANRMDSGLSALASKEYRHVWEDRGPRLVSALLPTLQRLVLFTGAVLSCDITEDINVPAPLFFITRAAISIPSPVWTPVTSWVLGRVRRWPRPRRSDHDTLTLPHCLEKGVHPILVFTRSRQDGQKNTIAST
ncbi:hypothetical protein VTN96DRAFT_8111 [Rasamsonia emersonii]